MSSWVALRRRVAFRPGRSVLILGVTGNAGRMAVRIARRLGAAGIVAAGRDPHRLGLLTDLGATEVILPGGRPRTGLRTARQGGRGRRCRHRHTWGAPTERAIPALLTHRTERAEPLDWIMGSGQGSVTAAGIVAELPSLSSGFAWAL
jgi:hypothetical protein